MKAQIIQGRLAYVDTDKDQIGVAGDDDEVLYLSIDADTQFPKDFSLVELLGKNVKVVVVDNKAKSINYSTS